MMEIIVAIIALVAVRHFCRFQPKSFTSAELPAIHQSRSEYRAQARRYI